MLHVLSSLSQFVKKSCEDLLRTCITVTPITILSVKVDLRTVINATLEFITMMGLTTKYSVAKSKQVQLSLLLILIILKRRVDVFIIIVIPTFALNVKEELLLVIAAIT